MASIDSLGLKQGEGTRRIPRYGVRIRVASNSTSRARAMSSATRFDLVLVYRGLTSAEWSSLRSFVESNRGVPVSVTYAPDNTVFNNCLFAERPYEEEAFMAAGGVRFNATVYLMQSD